MYERLVRSNYIAQCVAADRESFYLLSRVVIALLLVLVVSC